MTALSIFLFENDFPVRVSDQNGDPWFIGRDVCRALGFKQPESKYRMLDDDERGMLNQHTLGGNQDMVIVSEPGVYRLIAQSRTQQAKRFQRWLYHEVLPEIRRTGSYGQVASRVQDDVDVRYKEWQLRAVREARMIYGKAAARAMWERMGLPSVPGVGSVQEAGLDGVGALAVIISVHDNDIGQALKEGPAALLEVYGLTLKTYKNQRFLHVAFNHPHLDDLYADTQWAGKQWSAALRTLPDAVSSTTYFERHRRRSTRLPIEIVQDALDQ